MGGKPRKKATPYGLPDRITIYSQIWDIVYMDHLQKDDWLLGACEPHNRLIYIDKMQSRESMIDTLLHEIFHAYVSMSGLEPDEATEESFVTLAASSMIDIIRTSSDKFIHEIKEARGGGASIHKGAPGSDYRMLPGKHCKKYTVKD